MMLLAEALACDGDSDHVALCQDCLRLWAFDQLVKDENDPPGLCPTCKGQTCHCGGCMRTVRCLADGDFANPVGGLLRPDKIASWSPEAGVVFR
jgi:hypothetical protein